MFIANLADHPDINRHVGRQKVQVHPSTSITRHSSNPSLNSKVFFWEDPTRGREEASRLLIGKRCSIALKAEFFLGGNHRYDFITTALLDESLPGLIGTNGDIQIGNDVWIGYGATILSGTTIEDGAVVGARAVVTGRVPAYAIVAGNPGRVIRRRFSDEVIEALLRIRWWDWPEEAIDAHKALLCSGRIDELLALEREGRLPAPAAG